MEVCSASSLRRIQSIILTVVCFSVQGYAEAAQPSQAGQIDVRLLVDVSDRMRNADPQQVRAGAIDLLVQLLPEDAYAGIWTYARFVNMSVAHGRSNRLWKTQAGTIAQELPAVGGAANLPEAINAATWDLGSEPGRERHLVLVTDGSIRTGEGAAADEAAADALARTVLPQLRAAGYRVSVLLLPGSAQSEVDDNPVRQLAEATDGIFTEVADPSGLHAALVALFDGLVQPEHIPIAADQGFVVEQGLEEMTVLRLRQRPDEALTLTDPNGRVYSRHSANVGFRWKVGRDYDLVTFSNPPGGRWYFAPDAGPGALVLAENGLSPRVVGLPAMVFPGELKTFRLDLNSAAGAITDPDFLNLLDIKADVITDSGTEAVPVVRENGGPYQLQLLADYGQGDYQLRVQVSGPTFQRVVNVPFSIRNPIALRVVPGGENGVVWLAMSAGDLAPGDMTISAIATRPMLGAEPLNAESFPGGLWKIPLSGDPGILELSLEISGKRLNGNRFSIQTKPIVVTLPVLAGKRYSFDMDGAEVGAQFLPTAQAAEAPVARTRQSTLPEPEGKEAAFELPLWFVSLLAPLNLLVGFAVFFLVASPRRADAFLASVSELQALVGEPQPD